jgi:uncharacterized protein YceH (UPF0502 family)
MLRGAQTPGELKARVERLHPFPSTVEVEATLQALIDRDLVARLPRRPGQKEERYEQLLGAEADDAEPGAPPSAPPPDSLEERVRRLETEVAKLRDLLEGGS